MKIMLDAHNLGLKEPTGIGVYAYNLAKNLQVLQHDVSALYSMRCGSSSFPYNSIFFQKLATEGETDSSGILRWAYHGIPYYCSHFLGLGRQAKPINSEFELINNGLSRKLPTGVTPYNLPYLYRVSQAFAAISRRSLRLQVPNIDVLHLTLPLPIIAKNVKKVVTIHDLIPLKLPLSTTVNLKHYNEIMKASLRDADLIFSVSQQSKNDLVEIYRIPENKIHVTYQSSFIPDVLLSMSEQEMEPTLERYNLKYKKYFIYYGAIEPKKNVLRLLQAFSRARTDCKLVVLGKNGWLFEHEEKFFTTQNYHTEYKKSYQRGYEPNIVRIPYSDFNSLMTLLKGARALVFPSLYEGFGLPVLEAMQMGTPVITSRCGSLPEVAGDAAHYIDPYSVEDIKNAIEKYSTNESELLSMAVAGYKQSKQFSEEKYREKLVSGYDKLS